jgi:hypothetical protein
MKLLIYLLVFLSFSISLNSQKYEVRDLPNIDKLEHQFISGNANDYFDISYDYNKRQKVTETFITRYDRQLNITYAHSMGNMMQGSFYKGGLVASDRLVLFASTDGQMKRYIIDVNSGKPTGPELALYRYNADFTDLFYQGFSPDSSKFFALSGVRTKKGMDFHAAVFDRSLKLLYQFEISAGEKGDLVREPQFLLSNNGAFTLVYSLGKENRHEVYTAAVFQWVRVNEKGVPGPINTLPLQKNDMGHVILSLSGDTLKFSGLVSDDNKMFRSNIAGTYHIPSRQMIQLIETPFSDIPFFKSADRSYIRERMTGGIWKGFKFVKQYPEPDGGTLSLWEDRDKEVVQRSSSYSVAIHRAGTILVMKRDKNNQVQWFRMIVKAQEESDFDYFTSFVAMRDNDGGLTLLFHDNPSNAAAELGMQQTHGAMVSVILHQGLAAVYIDKNGKAKKDWVLHNSSRTTHLSPGSSASFYNGEVIYTAIRNRKLAREECQVGKLILVK